MIVKTLLEGGYIWIEHDDSVGVEDRIFVLKTQAPGHASFAMGTQVARDVGGTLTSLTQPQLKVGDTYAMEDLRRPTFWEWLTRKRVVQYQTFHRISEVH